MVKFDISTVSSHLAILLNAFLIWLIWKRSGKALTNYRKILYLGAIFDFIFSIINVLAAAVIVLSEEYYFIIIEGWISAFGHPFDYVIIVLHVYFSYSSISIATVQFIYRFFLMVWDITLNTKAFIALVIASFLSAAYMGMQWIIFFYPKENEYEIYGTILLSTGQVTNDQLKSFLVAHRSQPRSTSWFTMWQSIICFAIIIFCSFGVIYKIWKHQKNFAAADRKIQNQITVVLFCEAMVPLFTMIIPLQFLSFFARILPWFPPMLTYIIAFSPIFNPIVKIFVISPFRKSFFSIFMKKSQNTVIIVSSSNRSF